MCVKKRAEAVVVSSSSQPELPVAFFSRDEVVVVVVVVGGFLCKAPHTGCCSLHRPVPNTGVHRSPLRSPGSHNREAELLTSATGVSAVPCVPISEATAALSLFSVQPRPGVRGSLLFIQAAARVQQPDAADGRVPPAGSTGCEHTLQLHEAGKVCQPARSQ